MVFFESPHRTGATLAAMAEAFGVRPTRPPSAASSPRRTRRWSAARSPSSSTWAEGQEHGVRGEVTLVVAGAAQEEGDRTADELRALVAEAEADGLSRKDAIARVAAETGVRRQDVYAAAHDRSLG